MRTQAATQGLCQGHRGSYQSRQPYSMAPGTFENNFALRVRFRICLCILRYPLDEVFCLPYLSISTCKVVHFSSAGPKGPYASCTPTVIAGLVYHCTSWRPNTDSRRFSNLAASVQASRCVSQLASLSGRSGRWISNHRGRGAVTSGSLFNTSFLRGQTAACRGGTPMSASARKYI